MEQTKKEKILALHNEFKTTDAYSIRKNQVSFIPVFRDIITETLKKEKLQNQDLTDLIQILKWNCSNDNFDNKLISLIDDPKARNNISDRSYELEVRGFTNAGKTAVSSLTKKQLDEVKSFLLNAYNVKNIDEAYNLCHSFELKNIPEVKRGIYSPWLFYINPTIFPIVNNTHKAFKSYFNISDYYPETLKELNEYNAVIGESNLAIIDSIGHHFTKDGKLNYRKKIYLNGRRLFKLSHGNFYKFQQYRDSGIIEVLEKNNWVSVNQYTGKGAGETFESGLQIGDIVYVCYGGDILHCVGEIASNAKPFSKKYAEMIGDEDGEWLYREIKVLHTPINPDIKDLKGERSQIMPSGNSTLWQIKPDYFEYINVNLFIPKFNLEILEEIDEQDEEINEISFDSNLNKNNMSLNKILFGPPGTGKTFHSISHALAIAENKSIESILVEERAQIKSRFDQYINNGQIVFCTFHQSLSYEDFIEGIKPIEPSSEDEELTYAVEDGIFKRLCTEAAFSFTESSNTPETQEILDITRQFKNYVDWVNTQFLEGKIIKIKTKADIEYSIIEATDNKIIVQKDQNSKEKPVTLNKLSKVSKAFPDLENLDNIHQEFRKHVGGNITLTWAILNAVRKHSVLNVINRNPEEKYTYEDKKEIIKSLKNDDYKIENPKKYVLIIDEINRGNVSQIFGELITLIEDDKRLGKEEALKSTLPYSKNSFGVPHNLSVIGTMNTADRSVEALDTALRRRFSFIPMLPKPGELRITNDNINIPEILEILNTRLSVLKDHDHTIGHAWFWNVHDLSSFKIVFRDKIIPLLQEYFYNDYEKLGLLLGDAFFKPHLNINSNIFASFTGGNGLASQYDQSWQYQLKPADELTIDDFKSLEKLNSQPVLDEE